MQAEPNPPSDPRDPDHDLVEAVRRGDGAAFDALVRRHEARVHRLAWRILGDQEDALDAAQETFVKAWRAIAGFQGGAKFSTWLTRIAINQCRNELRRRRTVKHAHPLSLDAPLPSDGKATDDAETAADRLAAATPDPWESAREREVKDALADALASVEPEAREVILLSDGESLSYEEIAEILDVPVGTVRSRLHRARADVRRLMSGVLEERPRPPR